MKTQKFSLPTILLVALGIFSGCDKDSMIETQRSVKPVSPIAGINHYDIPINDVGPNREVADSKTSVDELTLVTSIKSEVIRHKDRPAPPNTGPGAIPKPPLTDDHYSFVLAGEGFGNEVNVGGYRANLDLTCDVKRRSLSGVVTIQSLNGMASVTYSIWGSDQFSLYEGELALTFRVRVEDASGGFVNLNDWGIGRMTNLSELFEDKSTIQCTLTIQSTYN